MENSTHQFLYPESLNDGHRCSDKDKISLEHTSTTVVGNIEGRKKSKSKDLRKEKITRKSDEMKKDAKKVVSNSQPELTSGAIRSVVHRSKRKLANEPDLSCVDNVGEECQETHNVVIMALSQNIGSFTRDAFRHDGQQQNQLASLQILWRKRSRCPIVEEESDDPWGDMDDFDHAQCCTNCEDIEDNKDNEKFNWRSYQNTEPEYRFRRSENDSNKMSIANGSVKYGIEENDVLEDSLNMLDYLHTAHTIYQQLKKFIIVCKKEFS
jgi:hypothetical protein